MVRSIFFAPIFVYNCDIMDIFKKEGGAPRKGKGEGKGGNKKGRKFSYKHNHDHGGGAFWNNAINAVLIFFVIATLYSFFTDNKNEAPEVPISVIASDVSAGLVSDIVLRGEKLEVAYKDGTAKRSKKETEASLSETFANYGISPEKLAGVGIEIKDPSGVGFWLLTLGPFLIPLILIGLFFWMVSRQVKGSGMQAFSFGQSKARMIDPKDGAQKVTFKDVAGVKEAKEELKEIVDFLKNPKKFLDIGARIPKGVLLMGAPGTGKTLLARAVAGEAEVPFFIISGSEFVEMFVGVGASRVRSLFEMVKKASPAIIFIDEIDAVGRVRGTGVGGGNDEREQTLNQILVEMDGFEPTEKVIVMAATNRPDVLDPALLRPGRFDRRVLLDLPDRDDRDEILRIHVANKPLASDVDLRVIAERTPGFAGADLYSLVNEAAILSAREDRKEVAQMDFIKSVEKVMLGPERRSHILSKREKKVTAYHEAGHALVASVLSHADPVHKVSIVARGHAGGYTLKLPLEEKKLRSRREFLDDIAVSLGGYVAERMIFDDLTTGPSNDLQVGTALARSIVARYGMSDEFGPVAFEAEVSRVSRGGYAEHEYSEHVSAQIDKEVSRIMTEAKQSAEKVLKDYEKVLHAIADELVKVETLERAEFEAILSAHGVKIKKVEIEAGE